MYMNGSIEEHGKLLPKCSYSCKHSHWYKRYLHHIVFSCCSAVFHVAGKEMKSVAWNLYTDLDCTNVYKTSMAKKSNI